MSLPGIFCARQIGASPRRQRSHSPQGSTAGTITALPIQRFGAGAGRDDAAADLVAERQRQRVVGPHAVVVVAEVGVADAAAGDGDHDFAGARLRAKRRALERRIDRGHQPAVGFDAHRGPLPPVIGGGCMSAHASGSVAALTGRAAPEANSGITVPQYRFTVNHDAASAIAGALICVKPNLPQSRFTARMRRTWRSDVQATVNARTTTPDMRRRCRRAGAAASISIALAGSGGSGVMTAGTLLLDAAAKAGLYGLMVRTSGPQIRGGEAAALVRLGADADRHARRPVRPAARDRLAERQPLRRRDSARRGERDGRRPGRRRAARRVQGDRRALRRRCRSRRWRRPFPEAGPTWSRSGLAGALAGIPAAALEAALRDSWKRTADALQANLAALQAGMRRRRRHRRRAERCRRRAHAAGRRWLISGNEAAGYGAIRGGVRFVAAYPITPATELLEWMAPALAKVGGTLLQAEDELASVNMIIGASYGGVPSLTATAGPGLALMTEGIGLAVSAEVPIVVVDVMRGGPSTGIPAKSEQSDLSFAVSGLHGDAPRLVLAPTSIADCLATTQWAVQLAEALQAPAIVLSDQFMGQSRAIIDRPADAGFVGKRLTAAANTAGLQALPEHRVGRLADGDSGHARRRLHGRRPRAHGGRHSEQPARRSPHAARQARAQAPAARLRPLVGRRRRRRRRRGDHVRLVDRGRARSRRARRRAGRRTCG